MCCSSLMSEKTVVVQQRGASCDVLGARGETIGRGMGTCAVGTEYILSSGEGHDNMMHGMMQSACRAVNVCHTLCTCLCADASCSSHPSYRSCRVHRSSSPPARLWPESMHVGVGTSQTTGTDGGWKCQHGCNKCGCAGDKHNRDCHDIGIVATTCEGGRGTDVTTTVDTSGISCKICRHASV